MGFVGTLVLCRQPWHALTHIQSHPTALLLTHTHTEQNVCARSPCHAMLCYTYHICRTHADACSLIMCIRSSVCVRALIFYNGSTHTHTHTNSTLTWTRHRPHPHSSYAARVPALSVRNVKRIRPHVWLPRGQRETAPASERMNRRLCEGGRERESEQWAGVGKQKQRGVRFSLALPGSPQTARQLFGWLSFSCPHYFECVFFCCVYVVSSRAATGSAACRHIGVGMHAE